MKNQIRFSPTELFFSSTKNKSIKFEKMNEARVNDGMRKKNIERGGDKRLNRSYRRGFTIS